MKCPICHNEDTKVVDSRQAGDGFSIRRRRECLKCAFRFSTFEELEILDINILKRNGKSESYQRDKLVSGLKRAFEKRPITDDQFKKLINEIERDIQSLRKSEVLSEQVGQIVMNHLKKQDKVAFIRFASVYKSFQDVEEFAEELEKLINKKKVRKD
jgi:transcriptional repressor NrdR